MLVLGIAGSAHGQPSPGGTVMLVLERSGVFQPLDTLGVIAVLNQQVATVPLGTSSGGSPGNSIQRLESPSGGPKATVRFSPSGH